MTSAALVKARNGDANAAAAAVTLWRSIVGHGAEGDADYVAARDGVRAVHAGAALDLIGRHVGSTIDVPDAVLRESVVRLAYFLSNTEATLGFAGIELEDDSKLDLMSEFHGAPLRRSGVMGLLSPWRPKRAGEI